MSFLLHFVDGSLNWVPNYRKSSAHASLFNPGTWSCSFLRYCSCSVELTFVKTLVTCGFVSLIGTLVRFTIVFYLLTLTWRQTEIYRGKWPWPLSFAFCEFRHHYVVMCKIDSSSTWLFLSSGTVIHHKYAIFAWTWKNIRFIPKLVSSGIIEILLYSFSRHERQQTADGTAKIPQTTSCLFR